MLTARGKKTENIAEYLLYMWQIEDVIRACSLNLETISQHIVSGFDQPESVKQEMLDWYESLIDMMKKEGITKTGHLQLNKNVILELDDLHLRLLAAPKEQFYTMAFRKVQPLILELRAKPGGEAFGEMETCLNFLYGVLMLRLQKKPISEETTQALELIREFVKLVATKYKQDKEEGIDFE